MGGAESAAASSSGSANDESNPLEVASVKEIPPRTVPAGRAVEAVTDDDDRPGDMAGGLADDGGAPLKEGKEQLEQVDALAGPAQRGRALSRPSAGGPADGLVGNEVDLETKEAILYNLQQISHRGEVRYWVLAHPWFGIALLALLALVLLPLLLAVLVLLLVLYGVVKALEPAWLVRLLPVDLLMVFDVELPMSPGEQEDVATSPMEDVATLRDGAGSKMVLESKALPFEGYPLNLDSGLYWYGPGGTRCSKGPGSEYFDASRPSVIYVHGWEVDAVTRGYRESINWRVFNPEQNKVFKRLSEKANCVDVWLAAGWNVGIFYWDGWSDEPVVTMAERKIYNGERMRWRKQRADGSTVYVSAADLNGGKCVADRLADVYREHFERPWGAVPHGEHPAVHLVGHSLGTQLVLECCRRLIVSQNTSAARAGKRVWLPDRLALLDPFFSAGVKRYRPLASGAGSGTTTARRAASTLALLHDLPFDIPVETYTTSIIGMGLVGGSCARLRTHTDYNTHFAACASFLFVDLHHVIAPHLYFSSLLNADQKGGAARALADDKSATAEHDQTSVAAGDGGAILTVKAYRHGADVLAKTPAKSGFPKRTFRTQNDIDKLHHAAGMGNGDGDGDCTPGEQHLASC